MKWESHMQTSAPKFDATKTALLEAAKEVLLSEGFSGLSTRAIAATADTQMSQIRYHFGSKEGIVLALYDYMTERLIYRQRDMFADSSLSISQKWDIACDYLDADIESGYVRVLNELLAQGWSNPKIAEAMNKSLTEWYGLHLALAEEFQKSFGSLGPFEAEDIAALVGPAFVGTEVLVLLGYEEKGVPLRHALRRFGNVIRYFENIEKGEE
jgi:AcrR family transcriptional regulator